MKKRYIILPALLIAGVVFLKPVSGKTKWYEKSLEDITRAIEIVENDAKRFAQRTATFLASPFKKRIKRRQFAIHGNPYKETIAVVRRGGPISEGEQKFIDRRRKTASVAMNKFVGFKAGVDVGLSLSGGGNRSATYTIGALLAMQKIGLLSTVTWMTTLSGSGWTVWPWLVAGSTLQEHKERLLASVTHGPSLRSIKHVKGVVDIILRDLAYGRLVNLATIYAAGLGSIFFDGLGDYNDPQKVWMDKIQENLNTGRFPFPIMTTLSVPDGRWFTVTPEEFGSASLSAFIPEWAGQRRFFGGASIGDIPYADRVPVSRWMGDSALAPGASFGDLFVNIFATMKEGPAKKVLRLLLHESPMERLRAIYSERFNPFRGIPDLPMYNKVEKKTWTDAKTIKLTDAGVFSGNPIIPLLERAAISPIPMVILVVDASSVIGYDELEKLKRYSDGENPDGIKLPFPDLPADREQLSTQPCTAFSNEKVLMLYLPMVKNEQLIEANKNNPALKDIVSQLNWSLKERMADSFNTFNLKFNRKKAEQLINLAQFNILVSAEIIRTAISEFVLKYLDKVNPAYADKVRTQLGLPK